MTVRARTVAAMGRARTCIVDGCAHGATADVPLGFSLFLDLPVCGAHARVIGYDPSGWRVTSVPVPRSSKYRTVIQPTG